MVQHLLHHHPHPCPHPHPHPPMLDTSHSCIHRSSRCGRCGQQLIGVRRTLQRSGIPQKPCAATRTAPCAQSHRPISCRSPHARQGLACLGAHRQRHLHQHPGVPSRRLSMPELERWLHHLTAVHLMAVPATSTAESRGQPPRPEAGADAWPCVPQLADAFQAAGKPLSLQAAQGLLRKDVLPRDRDRRMLQQGSLPMLPGVSNKCLCTRDTQRYCVQ